MVVRPPVNLSLFSDLEEIARAKQALQRFASESQLAPGVVQAVELALDELLTNVVNYGHAGTESNAIELTFELEVDAFKILISDAGIAFDPCLSRLPTPGSDLPVEDREVGGHGIQLVKQFMDSFSYRRQDNRNLVTLRKLL
jgi:anti-sigma regulatory factor (Ser/Thr protein kinase)